jgi:hypothetical protein
MSEKMVGTFSRCFNTSMPFFSRPYLPTRIAFKDYFSSSIKDRKE